MGDHLTFQGYLRPDGQVGVRNHLLVIPTITHASHVASRIAHRVAGAIALPHEHGEAEAPADLWRTFRTLAGAGLSPNIGAVLVVGLHRDPIDAEELARAIGASGKPVRALRMHEAGGTIATIQRGTALAEEIAAEIETLRREPVPVSSLVLGSKCGGSDFTSGLASNPALGAAADRLIAAGGTVVFAETPEIIGAEHLLAARAANPEIADRVFQLVRRYEDAVATMGVDMRGGNPAPGNIAGGITTIEEKSLGCISKGGSTRLVGVLEYAQRPLRSGLFFMDSPGNDIECVSGKAAAGAQIICFTTGRGTPTGSAIAPVIKICANRQTSARMRDNIDIDCSGILEGSHSIDEAGEGIFRRILAVASGDLTTAELLGHREFSISRIGVTM